MKEAAQVRQEGKHTFSTINDSVIVARTLRTYRELITPAVREISRHTSVTLPDQETLGRIEGAGKPEDKCAFESLSPKEQRAAIRVAYERSKLPIDPADLARLAGQDPQSLSFFGKMYELDSLIAEDGTRGIDYVSGIIRLAHLRDEPTISRQTVESQEVVETFTPQIGDAFLTLRANNIKERTTFLMVESGKYVYPQTVETTDGQESEPDTIQIHMPSGAGLIMKDTETGVYTHIQSIRPLKTTQHRDRTYGILHCIVGPELETRTIKGHEFPWIANRSSEKIALGDVAPAGHELIGPFLLSYQYLTSAEDLAKTPDLRATPIC